MRDVDRDKLCISVEYGRLELLALYSAAPPAPTVVGLFINNRQSADTQRIISEFHSVIDFLDFQFGTRKRKGSRQHSNVKGDRCPSTATVRQHVLQYIRRSGRQPKQSDQGSERRDVILFIIFSYTIRVT